MARSPKALVDPAVLRWLRTRAGFSIDEAAKRIPTKPENVAAWEAEAGDERPSMPQLRCLARIYKRPITDFFLSRPMPEPEIPHDFRRLPEDQARVYSPALRHEIRLAYRRRTLHLDLAQELEIKVSRFDARGAVTPDDDPEQVGATIREMLDVSAAEQARWREPRVGYNAWRQRIEEAGALVFQVTTVEKQQMLGFSLVFNELPVIGLNRKLRPNGRTFTMLHEFTHLLLGESSLCDIDESLIRLPREQKIEVFCNHVAGAALVPMVTLLEHPIVGDNLRPRDWADDALQSLARVFCVSEEVVLRRLLIAGRTTQSFYGRKRAEWSARMAALEAREKEKKSTDIKRNVARETVSNLGSFARLVVHSYQSDAINLTDASKFLGVKAEKVSAVGDLLR